MKKTNTLLAQCLATFLITNSHLEKLYPASVSWMAADGLLGVALFFLLAGFGLVSSERAQARTFPQYLWRRFIRIYPALWLVTLVFYLAVNRVWRIWQPWEYPRNFLYPTEYAFISQILVFYLFFFWLMKKHSPRVMLYAFAAMFVPYFWAYYYDVTTRTFTQLHLGEANNWVHVAFNFQAMLLGGLLAYRNEIFELGSWARKLALSIVFGVLFVVAKLLMARGFFSHYYFLLHLLTLAVIWSWFSVCVATEVWRLLENIKPLRWLVVLAGGLTLEIYLAHSFVLEAGWWERLPFPLNIVLFMAFNIPLCWLFAKAALWLRQRAERRMAAVS